MVFIGIIRGLKVVGTGLVALVDRLEYSSATIYGASSRYISSYIDLFKNSFPTRIMPATSLLSYLRTSYNLAASMAIL
jgi:hypothetical protein